MGQNLTQPEEIDQILRAMTSRDLGIGSPPPDKYQPSITTHNAKEDGGAANTGICRGAEHTKLTLTPHEAHPYAWSM